MNLRSLRIPTMLGALLAPLLAAGSASAQTYVEVRQPYAVYDGPRFRGGIDLELGGLLVPGVANLGAIGLRAQQGVQIDNNWAVYFQPSLDIPFGRLVGIELGAGLMVDYTFNHLPISVGVGPEVGFFGAGGGTCSTNNGTCTSISDAAGIFYGARLHFAYYPVIVRYPDRPRRRALAIGFDLRLLDGAFGTSTSTVLTNTTTASVTADGFGVSPMLSIGYTAF